MLSRGNLRGLSPEQKTIIFRYIFFSPFRDMHHIGVVLVYNSHI